MNYEITGTLIVKNDTIEVSEKFKKREFVIEKKETSANGFEFVDTIKFQLIQDKVDILDQFKLGDNLKVHFNIKGNKWEKEGKTSYFVNLDAWKIENVGGSNDGATSTPASETELEPESSDLPF